MIRAVLIGVLAGVILGGGAVGALSMIVLQEQTVVLQGIAADIKGMRTDINAIRKYSNVNAEEVLNGAIRADALAQARTNILKPEVEKTLPSPPARVRRRH